MAVRLAKKLFIRTYGCQMNVYDSERMSDMLATCGYTLTDKPEAADMAIINTCHIREKAAEKTYSELGRWRKLKAQKQAEGRRFVLAVAGCVAQAEGTEIALRAPFVDVIMGPQAYHRLPQMVRQAEQAAIAAVGTRLIDVDFPAEAKFDHMSAPRRAMQATTFLSVQEGCDKFCSFCVVPYTRGGEYSRPVEQILEEARRLAALGTREITLLGQNVNAYHGLGPDGKSWSLARLIYALAEIDGLARLRYTTSHPRDMTEALIRAHGDCDILMPYLHLPAQSGSDRILSAMNRKYTAEAYCEIIARLRQVRPDIALSGDFIVGFPGETDEDFAATLTLVKQVGYAQAYSFKYSPRPGTPAAAMTPLADAIKSERLHTLQALLAAQQQQFNEAVLGRSLPVLLDRQGRKPGQLAGRSPYLQAVFVEAPEAQLGQIVTVRITQCLANSLSGELSGQMAEPLWPAPTETDQMVQA